MTYSIAPAQPGDPLPHHLLLLADENQQLIDAYLPHSQLYLLTIDGQTRGVCVMQRQEEAAEIMNIAIDPRLPESRPWQSLVAPHNGGGPSAGRTTVADQNG